MTQNLKTTMQLAVLLLLGVCAALPVAGEQLPPGQVRIVEPIVLNGQGAVLQGSGVGGQINSSNLASNTTTIVWDAKIDLESPQQPMVRLNGSMQLVDRLCLSGKPGKHAASLKPIGILISQSKRTGIGNGKHEIGHLLIEDVGTAMQFGGAYSDRNCDETHVRTLHIHRADVGAKQVGFMAMGNSFDFVRGMQVKKLFQLYAGGDLTVHKVAIMAGCETLLDLPEEAKLGSNNGQLYFGHVKFDNQVGARGKLLTMAKHLNVDIVFNGVSFAFDDYNKKNIGTKGEPKWVDENEPSKLDAIIDARSPASIQVHNWRNVQRKVIRWHSRDGEVVNLRIHGARSDLGIVDWLDVENSEGRLRLTVDGAVDWQGRSWGSCSMIVNGAK